MSSIKRTANLAERRHAYALANTKTAEVVLWAGTLKTHSQPRLMGDMGDLAAQKVWPGRTPIHLFPGTGDEDQILCYCVVGVSHFPNGKKGIIVTQARVNLTEISKADRLIQEIQARLESASSKGQTRLASNGRKPYPEATSDPQICQHSI